VSDDETPEIEPTPAISDAARAKSSTQKRPGVQWIEKPEDLDKVVFVDDLAEIEVPVEALHLMPFKNDFRGDDGRTALVAESIRSQGYNNLNPICLRLGRRGRWVVEDGGHRLTAARIVSSEFFTNLLDKKVRSLHFILRRTESSNTLPPEEEAD